MINVQNVTKQYGSITALDNVSFRVKEKELLGFLGPNGAGKTTAMRIITTFIASTSGKVLINGIDVNENPIEVRKLIGYLPEIAPLYADMLVLEYLKFCGEARGLRKRELNDRIDWVIDACALKTVLKQNIAELSRGYKQRVGLAQALIHDPKILILDEPTSGLDPLQIIVIRNLIKELSKEKTIIFSTHILQEASAIADRILIINEGRIIADGTIEELERKAKESNLVIFVVKAERQKVEDELSKIDGITKYEFVGEEDGGNSRFEIRTPLEQDIRFALDRIAKTNNWAVNELHQAKISLEEAFLALTKQSQKNK